MGNSFLRGRLEKPDMPIYEYHCKSCKKNFEILQKISDAPLAKCPECGKKIKRLISQTSFSLKGDGWYKDGYSSTGSKIKSSAHEPSKKTEKKETKAEKTSTKKND